jgi:hypothetical protein
MPKRAYGRGGNKALRAMKKRYGAKKGASVFYAKANKYGKRGTSTTRKVKSTYGKGAKLRRPQKPKKRK